MPFPKTLTPSEKQTASCKIWTRVADSTSNNDIRSVMRFKVVLPEFTKGFYNYYHIPYDFFTPALAGSFLVKSEW